MRLFVLGMVVATPFMLSSCAANDGRPGDESQLAIETIQTSLRAASCRREIDTGDPNETPYLVCPGVGGYSLIVRHVDAGRQSIDVVNSARQVFPLDYHVFVTRYMSSLDATADWRVAMKDDQQAPVALIVRVHAREDNDNPEQVTHTYWAVAKISVNEACVTDRIPEGERSEAEVRSVADSALRRPCAPPQPHIEANGAVVR